DEHRWLVRGSNAAARAASSAEGGGTVRRDFAVPAVGGGAPDSTTAGPLGSERTRDKPSSRFVARARPPDCGGGGSLTDYRRLACRGPDRHASIATRLSFDRVGQDLR